MVRHLKDPTLVPAQGTPPKTIEEYVGRVNTGGVEHVSVCLPAFTPDAAHRDEA